MNILPSRLIGGSTSPEAPNQQVRVDPMSNPSIIRQYLRIAMRWRWVIAGTVALCTLAGVAVTLLMTPQYTATTTIEISRESDQVTDFKGVERETGQADQEFYQTQYGLLRARTLAERVASELRLIDDPAFFEQFGGAQDTAAFVQSEGRYPASGRTERQRIAGKILLDHIDIAPTRLSRLVDINFTGPDAAFASRVTNSWAENFIQTNLDRKVQSTSYGREQLQRQLADYKDRLDESQRQLVTYASNEEIINLPAPSGGDAGAGTQERSIVADNLATLNNALSESIADRIEAEAKANQAGRAGASNAALANPAINALRQRRAELAADYQQLMVRFEPGYPAAQAIESQIAALDRAIVREESRVTSSLSSDYRAALQRERALLARVEGLKSEFLDLRRRSIQYNIYQQEVDTNRALYDGLLQRFKEIGVAGGVGVNNVAIVDPSEAPEEPSSPQPFLNLLISIASGLLLGGALALALEQMDEAIADPTEVQRRLGLPLLGSVPKVEGETPREALLDRKSELVDGYLSVFTNLGFTTEHGVPRSFAVTSTRPGEGKSTTSLALATVIARAGKTVILVDGDMRSPSIHQLGGVDHERGLSNFLTGENEIPPLTFEMADLGISAMSAGPIPPNAAELLTGRRFGQLVERLLESYDHVVVDAPPVMGLADAPLIASQLEGVVFAIESQNVRSTIARTALNRLLSANVHIFGGVLTKFDSRKAHYGYGYEYGYSYGREATEKG